MPSLRLRNRIVSKWAFHVACSIDSNHSVCGNCIYAFLNTVQLLTTIKYDFRHYFYFLIAYILIHLALIGWQLRAWLHCVGHLAFASPKWNHNEHLMILLLWTEKNYDPNAIDLTWDKSFWHPPTKSWEEKRILVNIFVQQCNMGLKVDDSTFWRLENGKSCCTVGRKTHTPIHTMCTEKRATTIANWIFIFSNDFYGMQTEQNRCQAAYSHFQ